jgi:ribokinase
MMTSEIDLVVVGGANFDYLVKGPSLPRPGSTVQGDAFQESTGGKGANQAVAAARLGAHPALIARVGSDQRGESIIGRLAEESVDATYVVRDADAPTGVALVMVDASGEKQILTAPGANGRLTQKDVANAAELFATAKVVLLQLEVPLDTTEAAARLGRAAGARVVLDPAPAVPLGEDLLRDVHVIRPNASEAEVLTGIEVNDRRSAQRAAENLMRRGVGAACVGAPGGNLLLWPGGDLWLPHLPVDAVDATGAGDAFAAALAVEILLGRDLPSAARFANAAAALATTRVGAQAGLARREEVERLLESSAEHAGHSPL